METLSINQTTVNNTNIVNRYMSCKTSQCFKPVNDGVYKNHNHSHNKSSHEHCNINKFTILYQNIQGIYNKIDEFLNSVTPNAPQVICLTEHHLRTEEIRNINFSQYALGASFCRQTYSHGGICIFVPKNIQFYTINLDQYNKEKEFEICALKLNILSNSFAIICIYRSPTGNFFYFLNQLESILNKIYKTSSELKLCGDLNINSRKNLLDSLLASFSLFSTVQFPTRISNNSCTLIDNIYNSTYRHEFSVHPIINGLSDHDALIITLSNIFISVPRHVFSFTRKINNY
jgi:exonuclease III